MGETFRRKRLDQTGKNFLEGGPWQGIKGQTKNENGRGSTSDPRGRSTRWNFARANWVNFDDGEELVVGSGGAQ